MAQLQNSAPYVFGQVVFDDDDDEEDLVALTEALSQDPRAREWKFLPLKKSKDYRLDGALTMPREWHSRLSHFQRMGIAWLYHRTVKGSMPTGAIVADKTSALDKRLQLLAFFECLAYSGSEDLKRALVVVDGYQPIASYLELIRSGLCTLLPVHVLHGKKAHCERVLKEISQIQSCGIVLTTHEVLLTYLDAFTTNASFPGANSRLPAWDFVVLDHVHTKFMQRASLSQVAKVSSKQRIVLCDVPFRPDSFSDIYEVAQYVSYDAVFESKQNFLRQYIRLESPSKIGGAIQLEPLLEKLRPIVLRRELSPEAQDQLSSSEEDSDACDDPHTDDASVYSDASGGFCTAEGECMDSDDEIEGDPASPLNFRPLTATILKPRPPNRTRRLFVEASDSESNTCDDSERLCSESREQEHEEADGLVKEQSLCRRPQPRPRPRPRRRIMIESSDSEDDTQLQIPNLLTKRQLKPNNRRTSNIACPVGESFESQLHDQENAFGGPENKNSLEFAWYSTNKDRIGGQSQNISYSARAREADKLRLSKGRTEREQALSLYLDALEISSKDPLLHVRAATLAHELYGNL